MDDIYQPATIEAETQRLWEEAGIFLATEKPDQGEVIAVGAGKILEDGKVRPMSVKVGERVLFGKYGGQQVKVDGEELLVLREDDIMGVVEA